MEASAAGADGRLDELREAVRHFFEDEPLDREGFVNLVRLLHELPPSERSVAYDHLLSCVGDPRLAVTDDQRGRALARLADLVGREPPEIGDRFGPSLGTTG
ncbi:MAG: hypothetical protein JWM71_493 [Solirubrobacteraceae bacterium]|nr:hypothetical protein [Solirubrobacteraceae bacterium]